MPVKSSLQMAAPSNPRLEAALQWCEARSQPRPAQQAMRGVRRDPFALPSKTKTMTSWMRLRWKVLQRDGFRCQYCGVGVRDGAILHIDHIVPRVRGGTDIPNNLKTACRECNLGKGTLRV